MNTLYQKVKRRSWCLSGKHILKWIFLIKLEVLIMKTQITGRSIETKKSCNVNNGYWDSMLSASGIWRRNMKNEEKWRKNIFIIFNHTAKNFCVGSTYPQLGLACPIAIMDEIPFSISRFKVTVVYSELEIIFKFVKRTPEGNSFTFIIILFYGVSIL